MNFKNWSNGRSKSSGKELKSQNSFFVFVTSFKLKEPVTQDDAEKLLHAFITSHADRTNATPFYLGGAANVPYARTRTSLPACRPEFLQESFKLHLEEELLFFRLTTSVRNTNI